MIIRSYIRPTLALFLSFVTLCLSAQKRDTSAFVKLVTEQFKKAHDDADSTYKERQLQQKQRQIKISLLAETQRAQSILQNGIDTSLLKLGITKVNGYLNLVSSGLALKADGIHLKGGSIQTQRNLTVSSNILNEISTNLNKAKKDLDAYAENVYGSQRRIDSLASLPELFQFKADSANILRFVAGFTEMLSQSKVTNQLEQVNNSLPMIQQSLNLLLFKAQAQLDLLKNHQRTTSSFSLKRDMPNLWEKDTTSSSFKESIVASVDKIRLAFRFYMQDQYNIIALSVLAIFIGVILLVSMSREAYPNHLNKDDKHSLITVNHPIYTGVFLGVNLMQLLFSEPPFLFSAMLWLISFVLLTMIFYGHLSKYWMKYWIATSVLFIASLGLNLILDPSVLERWLMTLLAVAGISHGIYNIRTAPRHELRVKQMLYISAFTAFCCGLGFLLNLFGRYNLSKTLISAGLIGAFVGIALLWAVRMLKEIREIATIIYRDTHRKDFKIDIKKINTRIAWYLNAFTFVAWIIVVGRNFYAFNELAAPFDDFLEKERILGNYTFTINGLFLFVIIMAASLMLSKVTSYFASEADTTQVNGKKSKMAEIGSWVLLLRIFIICTGIFLACAAAGIPMDRLGLIIGALGVGIGLGLQGLVNNLVSGLIIAFEKPVNVGDLIEVNSKMATMKSIGFRSSVLVMNDGASVIIPNGDLLSGQLTNWTIGRGVRRMSILIGVAYGSDLQLVKDSLLSVLVGDHRVLSNPEPVVLVKEFSASSIDFELLFWAANVREAAILRSDTIAKIDIAFREAGIDIPFPQQDIYIKTEATMPGTGDTSRPKSIFTSQQTPSAPVTGKKTDNQVERQKKRKITLSKKNQETNESSNEEISSEETVEILAMNSDMVEDASSLPSLDEESPAANQRKRRIVIKKDQS